MPVPVAAYYVGAALLGGFLILRNNKDSKRGTDAEGRKVAPTSGTAAFDRSIFDSPVPAPPLDAPPAVQEAFAREVRAVAEAAPATRDQVAVAAEAAGVTEAEFRGAAAAAGVTPEVLVAMGATPRDINDLVAQSQGFA